MSARARAAALLAALLLPYSAHAAGQPVEDAQRAWASSPHGAMLERILPPAVSPAELPEPASEGARLTVRYCVQCHHLASPAMHTAKRWPSVVQRMVWRMHGNGNMGTLMKEMMAHVEAPTAGEVAVLLSYLTKHAQGEIAPRHAALSEPGGGAFALACSQCHALPDPRRHTAREWPGVVARMKRHLAWTNTIVGSPELKTVPELRTDDIVKLLQRHSRPAQSAR